MFTLAHPQGHLFTPDVSCSLMFALGQLEGHLFTPNVNMFVVFIFSLAHAFSDRIQRGNAFTATHVQVS